MSSSTSNFNEIRVPLVSIAVGVALILFYHFLIVGLKVRPGWVVSPFKLNEAAVERYAYSTKPAYIVAIGSSLLNRPAARITNVKVFENLCLKGYCSLDGAVVIADTHRWPKLLIVEVGHTLETERRYHFEDEIPEYRRVLSMVTPVVRIQYQPASLLVRIVQNWQNKINAANLTAQKQLESRNNQPTTNANNEKLQSQIQVEKPGARVENSIPNTTNSTTNGERITSDIKSGDEDESVQTHRTEFNTGNSTGTTVGTDSTRTINRTSPDTASGTNTSTPINKDDSGTAQDSAPSRHQHTAGRIDLVDPSFLPAPQSEEGRRSKEAAVRYAKIDKQIRSDPRRPDAPWSGQLPTIQRMSLLTRKRFLRNVKRLSAYVEKFEAHGTTVCFVIVPESPDYMKSARTEQHREILNKYFPRTKYKWVEWTGPEQLNTIDGAHLTEHDSRIFADFMVSELGPVWKSIERTAELNR